MTFNAANVREKVERGLVWFEPEYNHPKRCVPCNNPVPTPNWDAPRSGPVKVIPGDYVTDDTPLKMGRWRAEGGLLSEGGHKCGMMWVHKIVAKSPADLSECFAHHQQEIADRGQTQTPSVIEHVHHHQGTTLALQWYSGNPGHQLMDSMFSLVPIILASLAGEPPYSKIILQQEPEAECTDSEWICAILKKLAVFGSGVHEVEQLQQPPHTLNCFERLLVPRPGLFGRDPRTRLPLSAFVEFKAHLARAFHLDLSTSTSSDAQLVKRMLVYAHKTTGRRAWVDAEETMRHLKPFFEVEYVTDFSALTVEQQARKFHEAEVVVMVHGGQMANVIFCRPSTVVIEISCTGYSHINTAFPLALLGIKFRSVSTNELSGGCLADPQHEQDPLHRNVSLSAESLAQHLVELEHEAARWAHFGDLKKVEEGPALCSSLRHAIPRFEVYESVARHIPVTPLAAAEKSGQQRILCWVFTSEQFHQTRAVSVKHSWGSKCEHLVFISNVSDASLPSITVDIPFDSHDNLWQKTQAAIITLHRLYGEDYDWFVKADDDTFLLMENLRRYLQSREASDARTVAYSMPGDQHMH
eukprot:gene388-720_t